MTPTRVPEWQLKPPADGATHRLLHAFAGAVDWASYESLGILGSATTDQRYVNMASAQVITGQKDFVGALPTASATPTASAQLTNRKYVDDQIISTASAYLSLPAAASAYVRLTSAASAYITYPAAASAYLTLTNAASAYLRLTDASSAYVSRSGDSMTGNLVLPVTTNLAAIAIRKDYADSTFAGIASAAVITGLWDFTTSLPRSALTPTASSQFINKDYGDTTYLGLTSAASAYLRLNSAASAYLRITDAASAYLTLSNAASAYLTLNSAASAYPTFVAVSSAYIAKAGDTVSGIIQFTDQIRVGHGKLLGSVGAPNLTYFAISGSGLTNDGTMATNNIGVRGNGQVVEIQASLIAMHNGSFNVLNLSGSALNLLFTPIAATHAITKGYADDKFIASAAAASAYLRLTDAASAYLRLTDAASAYLRLTSAASAYPTFSAVASAYATYSAAASAYLTFTSAASAYSRIGESPLWSDVQNEIESQIDEHNHDSRYGPIAISDLAVAYTFSTGGTIYASTPKLIVYFGASGQTVNLPDAVFGADFEIDNVSTVDVAVSRSGDDTIILNSGGDALSQFTLSAYTRFRFTCNQSNTWHVSQLNIPVLDYLPASGIDGYIVDFQNTSMKNIGVMWRFRYQDDGVADTYPWQFVGGPPIYSSMVNSEEGVSSAATWLNLATDGPGVAVPLAGDYDADCWAYGFAAVASLLQMGTAVGNATPAANRPQNTSAVNQYANLSSSDTHLAVASGSTIKMRYYGGTVTTDEFGNRRMRILPVRVKAT